MVQGIIEEETSKMLKAEANEIIKEEKVSNSSYTVAGVEYDTATGLPYTYVDGAGNKYTSKDLERLNTSSGDTVDGGTFRNGDGTYSTGFEDATTIDQILGEPDEGTFTEGGTYIPPGFEGATTIDGDSPT